MLPLSHVVLPEKVLNLEQLLCQLEQRPPISAGDIDNYLRHTSNVLREINTRGSLEILSYLDKFDQTTLGKRCCLDMMAYEANTLLFQLTRMPIPVVYESIFQSVYKLPILFKQPLCSLVIPTRGRLWHLNLLLRSVIDTSPPKDIEILFLVDEDDSDTINYLESFKNSNPKYRVKIKVGPRPTNLSVAINKLALKAKGKFIWAINNDCMLHEGWLEYLRDLYHKEPRLLNVDDDQNHQGHCSFPILTRVAVKALGGVLPKEIPTVQADSALWGIFAKYNSSSIISLKGIKISHFTMENGKRRADSQNLRRNNLATQTSLNSYQENDYINLLKSVTRGIVTKREL